MNHSQFSNLKNYSPKFCVIRTSIKTSEIDGTWATNVLYLAIGTYFHIDDLKKIKKLLHKMESRGFRFVVVGDIAVTEIAAGDTNDDRILADNTGKYKLYSETMVMPDALGKTGLIRFNFFFTKNTFARRTMRMVFPYFSRPIHYILYALSVFLLIAGVSPLFVEKPQKIPSILTSVDSPDGSLHASALSDGTIKIWEKESGWLLKTIRDIDHDGLEKLNFGRDKEEYVLTVSKHGAAYKKWKIKMFPEPTLRLRHTLINKGGYRSLISPYTNQIILANEKGKSTNDQYLEIWDYESGREVFSTYFGHLMDSWAVCPNGKFILGDDSAVGLVTRKGNSEFNLKEYNGAGNDFYADIIVSSNGQNALIFRFSELTHYDFMRHKADEFEAGDLELSHILATSDWKKAITYNSSSVTVWDMASRKKINTFTFKGAYEGIEWIRTGLTYNDEGTQMITLWNRNDHQYSRIKILDTANGEILKEFEKGSPDDCWLAMTPTSRWVITASADGKVSIWDPKTGKKTKSFDFERCDDLHFATDGGWFITNQDYDSPNNEPGKKDLKIWDLMPKLIVELIQSDPVN